MGCGRGVPRVRQRIPLSGAVTSERRRQPPACLARKSFGQRQNPQQRRTHMRARDYYLSISITAGISEPIIS